MGTTKIALVTGANKGIGKEIARQLGSHGMTVLVGARDEGRGRATAAELADAGLAARAVQLDVTDEESVAAAAKLIDHEYGRLEVLVNNAGILLDRDKPSTADFLNTFHTNVVGAYSVTMGMLPLLLKGSSPRVVNLSSELGSMDILGDPDSAFADTPPFYAYNSSKAALNAVTVLLAKELAEDGIKVNAVSPGYCATDMNDHQGVLPASDGAAIAVRFATLADDGPTGEFHGHTGRLPW
jgi:NAD(P)-dependent dehydrogenase (short-subunit alcohol dehydrogenase family)